MWLHALVWLRLLSLVQELFKGSELPILVIIHDVLCLLFSLLNGTRLINIFTACADDVFTISLEGKLVGAWSIIVCHFESLPVKTRCVQKFPSHQNTQISYTNFAQSKSMAKSCLRSSIQTKQCQISSERCIEAKQIAHVREK